MILYIKDCKNFAMQLLQLKNTITKIAGYKINTQKSVTFLCKNNKWSEKEIRETILLRISSKILGYL
jgi:intein-encoded DNA endonuclease-like protein